MCEMMKIMQENREVTCCLGSSANFRNSRLFLQSDVRSAHIFSQAGSSFKQHRCDACGPFSSTASLWTLCTRPSAHGKPSATPPGGAFTTTPKASLLSGSPDSSTASAAPWFSTKETASAWSSSLSRLDRHANPNLNPNYP